ncbi:single-stranded DNA-binding protein [Silanimonas sp.]|jgi:single-stranded DNA-binding protein|uniref:single-stranded DNA-binding protein n=1 Tax=Silanimonas sp. TaxID=1929290 RepID=UPI0022C223F5|nr:single-stranded DNA-binding protein [Silanimonas sp.]MCZ8165768.1 single-stranded DNA-binding protein [Silanimonas sp.]
MIEALISGKLVGKPEPRTSRGGTAYVLARLRVPSGVDDLHFVRLTAFSDTACAALLALDDGDAVAVAGTLKAGAWQDRDGAARPNLDMVVAQVLTAYHLQRRRQAMQPSTGASAAEAAATSSGRRGCASRGLAPAPAPDHSPEAAAAFGAASDDAWLVGGAGE